MFNITIVFTTHQEIGNCNSLELYKITELIHPEIVFEELSKTAFYKCYNLQNLTTLETNCIKLYKRYYDIKHIPVVETELGINTNSKFEIMTTNDAYCSLIEKLKNFEGQLGFQYLNSNMCDILFDQIKETELSILIEKGDEALYKIYNYSEKEIERYENEIIENIYNYSKANTFDKAILFLGAAHRKSVMRKINFFKDKKIVNINWTTYNSSL